jgi:hypothetical protein
LPFPVIGRITTDAGLGRHSRIDETMRPETLTIAAAVTFIAEKPSPVAGR